MAFSLTKVVKYLMVHSALISVAICTSLFSYCALMHEIAPSHQK